MVKTVKEPNMYYPRYVEILLSLRKLTYQKFGFMVPPTEQVESLIRLIFMVKYKVPILTS